MEEQFVFGTLNIVHPIESNIEAASLRKTIRYTTLKNDIQEQGYKYLYIDPLRNWFQGTRYQKEQRKHYKYFCINQNQS